MAGAQATGEGVPSFGKRFAILNLDLMAIMFDSIKKTDEGELFISNCVRWNEAVHQHHPRPLTIFTTLCFSNYSQPELARPSPFANLIDKFGDFVKGSPEVQIDKSLKLDEKDIVLHKTRWYAGAGNGLEQILKAQNISTVVISGITLSGVVMSTVYRLFDLDYNIYVVSDNVMEFPGEGSAELRECLLTTQLKNMNVGIITLDEALKMLEMAG
ncbi:hypothetical protein CGMCC3_g15083 [Colletotrichum fructicola]|uniref:Cysteine hydrolase family protein n=1 Tax=Colletotrichum fructicola (strain Nara gc5) TaxID=1213859 RepID=L2G085_COLFN|nr:uncharacterized protein CGMCC3_g15083 [Colletotrichum fructicola]KAE9568806.1 hypothetical protein CGMCC3_g15083 [Colletotrichum fructicola]KAF4493144.1 hypothetical protein CGGC5_v002612 [Colletotrichum fructicola Nara gc5]KAF4890204.1 hypothetical protein CGCFRS4_v008850 [Colletotrichum fructicola]